MTFKRLAKIIKENNIPEDVHLMSDSGWEVLPTDIAEAYYIPKKNVIIFTQAGTHRQSDENVRKLTLKQREEGAGDETN